MVFDGHPEAGVSWTQQASIYGIIESVADISPAEHTHCAFTLFHSSRSQPLLLTFGFHKQIEWLSPPVFNCLAMPCVASKRPHSNKWMYTHTFNTQIQLHVSQSPRSWALHCRGKSLSVAQTQILKRVCQHVIRVIRTSETDKYCVPQ